MKDVTINLTNIQEEGSYNYYQFDILADGQLVGAASVMATDEDDDHAYVDRIDVDEEYRNNGYGTAALQQISERWYGVEIAADNEDANRLYQRLGEESDWEDGWSVDQGYGVYRI